MKKELLITSWNVNGIRAGEKKGFHAWLAEVGADIVNVQETKARPEQLSAALIQPEGYSAGIFNSAEKAGYSGTATWSLLPILSSSVNFSHDNLNHEGRIVQTEYEDFYLLNVYFPNGKQSDTRLNFKMAFYDAFLDIVRTLEKTKPVIFCGDVNTAHTEIDLARPKENQKVSGFLPEERAWIDRVIECGFVDTFRMFQKDGGHYSWWDMQTRARDRDIGWRIDYFFVSGTLKDRVVDAGIMKEVMGSDHAPTYLTLKR